MASVAASTQSPTASAVPSSARDAGEPRQRTGAVLGATVVQVHGFPMDLGDAHQVCGVGLRRGEARGTAGQRWGQSQRGQQIEIDFERHDSWAFVFHGAGR